jgi:hypothetical protein
MRYRADIDGLRALAVVPVLCAVEVARGLAAAFARKLARAGDVSN